jgi:shikimate kinase
VNKVVPVRDRSHLYAEVADVTIDTDRSDTESVATALLQHLRRLPASR